MPIPVGLEPTTPCLEGGLIVQYLIVFIIYFILFRKVWLKMCHKYSPNLAIYAMRVLFDRNYH